MSHVLQESLKSAEHFSVYNEKIWFPTYSHQSKFDHGGVLTAVIKVEDCHQRISTIEYNDDDDDNDDMVIMKRSNMNEINAIRCCFPPLKITIMTKNYGPIQKI